MNVLSSESPAIPVFMTCTQLANVLLHSSGDSSQSFRPGFVLLLVLSQLGISWLGMLLCGYFPFLPPAFTCSCHSLKAVKPSPGGPAVNRQCGCSCSTMGKHLMFQGWLLSQVTLRKCKKCPDEQISLSLVLVQYFLITDDKLRDVFLP